MEGWPKSLVICAPGHTNREQAASLAPASGGNLNIMNLMGWYMINLFIFLYISWYFISYIPAIFVLVVKSLTMSPPKSWYLPCVYIYIHTPVCVFTPWSISTFQLNIGTGSPQPISLLAIFDGLFLGVHSSTMDMFSRSNTENPDGQSI